MSSDEMDLLVEQVKMLAEEIALGTSTLKRLVDQSVNDPDSSKDQVLLNFLLKVPYVYFKYSTVNLKSVMLHSPVINK